MGNLDILLTKAASAFLLPPLNLLVLLGVGIFFFQRRPRLSRTILLVSCVLLYLMSTPVLVGALRRQFESAPPLDPGAPLPPAEAIVVLGGGLYRQAPEYGEDTVDGYVLERLRYAARLYRRTGKPVLVSAGSWREGARPESHTMKDSLEQDFHVPARWIEDQSRNTAENARMSAAILRQQNIHTIYLVTHALHMPRAQIEFERTGLHVIPAPTMFATRDRLSILHFLPQGSSLGASDSVLHEWIGRLWYALKRQEEAEKGSAMHG